MQGATDPLLIRAVGKSILPLWSSDVPGIEPDVPALGIESGKFENIRNPDLTVYDAPADICNGGAVVICPGGGYRLLSCLNEGYSIAEWLNGFGFKAYVLRYRLPSAEGKIYRHPVPLKDVQRAIRIVRASAVSEGRDPERVGIIGFSAGGHLAASAMTQFATPVDEDPVSCRPDFGILIYPVISFYDEKLCHAGSRSALLGDEASAELLRKLSPELNVCAQTPPAFLAHARNDVSVPFGNSEVMHEALCRAGVESELHLYEEGGHGFGLGRKDLDCSRWTGAAERWLAARNRK